MGHRATPSRSTPEATDGASSHFTTDMEPDQINLLDTKRLYAECHGCEAVVPLVFGAHDTSFKQVESGLSLPFNGHYGGFLDTVFDPYAFQYLTLCHGCCVKFFETFPKVADRFRGRGLHPYEGAPCCEFGWSAREVI